MRKAWLIAILMIAASVSGCRSRDNDVKARANELAARERAVDARLTSAGTSDTTDPVAKWIMPRELAEISGLALTADQRLLAHDDETGKIYEIDPKRGVIVKRFLLGDGPHGDFEGITVAGSYIYMIASNGHLYQFREGANGTRVPYTIHDTKLGKDCEFEGVAYEADSARLVMPCKRVKKKHLRDQVVIYRWVINDTTGQQPTMLSVPLSEVIGSNDWKSFRPSDITIDPTTGNYVIISSLDKGIVEMTPAGDIVRSEPLPGAHPQAEGVAITTSGMLIISDEATSKPAAITLYAWRPSGDAASSQ